MECTDDQVMAEGSFDAVYARTSADVPDTRFGDKFVRRQ